MVAFALSDASHEKKYHSKIVNENNHFMSILLTFYLKHGTDFIPLLKENLAPLDFEFTLLTEKN